LQKQHVSSQQYRISIPEPAFLNQQSRISKANSSDFQSARCKVFKFFKELIDSAKEGVQEAKTEIQQEAQLKAEAEATRLANELALFEASAPPAMTRFAVALAAPYRAVFSSELENAERDSRRAYGFEGIGLLGETEKSWASLLERDFSITDETSAMGTVSHFRELLRSSALDPNTSQSDRHNSAAVWIVRVSYVIVTSAALGYFSPQFTFDLLRPFALEASQEFSGWDDLGQSFLRGEKHEPGSNFLGRKLFASTIDGLLVKPISPWVTLPWNAGNDSGNGKT
jgi:Protein of unknown function (DUF1266)